MADDTHKKCLLRATEIEGLAQARIRHPFNPNSDVRLRRLSELAGLGRVQVSLARVPPGKESFAYHAHESDEEFVFILSGRGRAQIGDETVEVGPGDFMGFAAAGAAHHLTNPYDEDLVYLMGGERSRVEVGIFPEAGKRIIFTAGGLWQVDEADLRPMSFDDFVQVDGDDEQ